LDCDQIHLTSKIGIHGVPDINTLPFTAGILIEKPGQARHRHLFAVGR
jgi:hypothetical protein